MAVPNLISIIVRDMPASLAFYRLLGLEIPAEADLDAHVELTLPGGFRLAWDTLDMMRSIDPEWPEPAGHRMGLAFLCESPGEVDQLYGSLLQAGYQGSKDPWDAFWGQRYAIISDPDGNWIDLFAPLQ
jgi:catechol 2,3-dioxygenase-like lactoylglutathione lyase family enzyme